jgi:hypothetical protein
MHGVEIRGLLRIVAALVLRPLATTENGNGIIGYSSEAETHRTCDDTRSAAAAGRECGK